MSQQGHCTVKNCHKPVIDTTSSAGVKEYGKYRENHTCMNPNRFGIDHDALNQRCPYLRGIILDHVRRVYSPASLCGSCLKIIREKWDRCKQWPSCQQHIVRATAWPGDNARPEMLLAVKAIDCPTCSQMADCCKPGCQRKVSGRALTLTGESKHMEMLCSRHCCSMCRNPFNIKLADKVEGKWQVCESCDNLQEEIEKQRKEMEKQRKENEERRRKQRNALMPATATETSSASTHCWSWSCM